MNRNLLIIFGVCLIFVHAFTAWLSHQFVFGQGYQERPIVLFVSMMAFAGIIYFFALEIIRRDAVHFSKASFLMFICVTGLLMRLTYSSSNLIQETDPFRYIWDGQAMIQGANPYQLSPQDAFNSGIKPYKESQEAVDVYTKINHEGVRTIYPPLAQWLFAISQWITPWKLVAWKWMVSLADCAVIGILIAILGRLNIPKAWVALYAWSPLVIKEFGNSVHLDVFALLMLCLMMYALIRKCEVIAYMALLGAVLIKLFALVLLPTVVIWQIKFNKQNLIRNIFVFIGLFVLAYIPFMNAGVFVTEGLGRFLSEWHTNAGLFSLINWGVSIFSLNGATHLMVSRVVSMTIFSVGLIFILFWLNKSSKIESLFIAMAMVVVLLFFLIPTGNPWYYTWVLLFLPFLPIRALILFSVLVFGYYLDFYFTYHDVKSMFIVVQWIEYGVFFVLLGGELWRRRLPSLSRS